MSESWIDPGDLEGEALRRWYLRSPADVEWERRAAAARGYRDFFYGGAPANDPDRQVARQVPASSQGIDPGFARPAPSGDTDHGFAMSSTSRDIVPGFTRAATGPNRLRSERITSDGQPAVPTSPANGFDDGGSMTDGALRSNVSYRRAASAPPINNSLRPAGAPVAKRSQQPSIDPSKTPVFQTGPDGKLHPVPGWRTTGPFDFGAWSHNIHWGGVAKDLINTGMGVATFFGGVGLGGELLSALGPEAETAVAEGIAEGPAVKAAADAIHRHHVDPKYMGGAADGETVDLAKRLHQAVPQHARKSAS